MRLLIAAVEVEAGDFEVSAEDEVAGATWLAIAAVAAVPADSHAIADRPRGHVGTDGIDHSRDLMAGHARILETGPMALLDEKVAVADTAGGDFHTDGARSGFGKRTL